MKVRLFVICLMTAVVIALICAPGFLEGILPGEIINAASLDDFPLLNTCGRIARSLVDAVRGRHPVDMSVFSNILDQDFWDQLVSLFVVSALSIPVSLLLGFTLYRPLYTGFFRKGLLYASLNLCSVMIAWLLYRHVYFRLLIEGLIKRYINEAALQTAVNYITQLVSAFLVGAVAIRIAVAALAAHLVMHRVVLPVLGTLLRTLLFAFLTVQIMLLQANPADWMILLPMMAVTLILSGISDGIFGS